MASLENHKWCGLDILGFDWPMSDYHKAITTKRSFEEEIFRISKSKDCLVHCKINTCNSTEENIFEGKG